MNKIECFRSIIQNKELNTLPNFLKALSNLLKGDEASHLETIKSVLVDSQFISELMSPIQGVDFAFGQSMRDIKCMLTDEESRLHELYITYEGVKTLKIAAVDLPYAPYLDLCFSNLRDLVGEFKRHVERLQNYFYELENLDNNCIVLEPFNPSCSDDYRVIQIDSKTLLHVEVTPNGSPSNLHIIGNSEIWEKKLQDGILNWDYDRTIADNLAAIFYLNDQSDLSSSLYGPGKPAVGDIAQKDDDIVCGICFSFELPDNPSVPQPLCHNSNCNVYFHTSCLIQWLVICEGGKLPSYGVISGKCPTCLQPISCNNN